MTRATELLQMARGGNTGARDELLEILYDELHRLAAHRMAGERSDHTLQATALVNEAFLRLFSQESPDWQGTDHFLGIAARSMRQILIDHARKKEAEKRGGGCRRVTLSDDLGLTIENPPMVELGDALTRLEELNPLHSKTFELRFIVGLKEREVAALLGCTTRAVRNYTRFARAWLSQELSENGR